jgi:hypothetical protein
VGRTVGDDSCGGDVSILHEIAALASVHPLMERLRRQQAARGALLSGALRGHSDQNAARLLELRFEAVDECGPPLVEDRAIEPCLRPDPSPGVFDGAAGRANHARDVQLLDREDGVLQDESSGDRVVVSATGSGDPFLHACETVDRPPPTS